MPPPLSPQTTDQLLLLLIQSTPPPPHHWEWPTAAFPPDLQDAAALLGRSLITSGMIRTIRDDGQLYTWTLSTIDGDPMATPQPPTPTDLKRHTVLKWLRENTPANEWWTLKRRICVSDKFVEKKNKKYEYNQVHSAMAAAGISYSAAYMTMSRACELGLAMQGDRQTPLFGYWKWTALGRGVTNDFEVQDLIDRYTRLPESRQLAFINCISTKPLGTPTVKYGDYEFRAYDIGFTDSHTNTGLCLRSALWYKGKKLYDLEFSLADQSEVAPRASTPTPAPASTPTEPSDDEIEAAAIAKHRAEMAELAAADFDYEGQPNE